MPQLLSAAEWVTPLGAAPAAEHMSGATTAPSNHEGAGKDTIDAHVACT